MNFRLQDRFQLESWQVEACESWLQSNSLSHGPRHGIITLFTGAGKTVVALACLAKLSQEKSNRRFAVIAPTAALARQWQRVIPEVTTLPASKVGVVGDGSSDTFHNYQILVFVINSARRRHQGVVRLSKESRNFDVTLVVDECHRSGAKGASAIFEANTEFRLGLSATPERQEVDPYGRPIPLSRQLHGRALGPICYRLNLRDGYRKNLLPRYRITHHGITLSEEEKEEYDALSNNVADAVRKFDQVAPGKNYLNIIQRGPRNTEQGKAALKVQSALLFRKRWLYNRPERFRVASEIIRVAWKQPKPPRGALLFNERIGDYSSENSEEETELVRGAVSLYEDLIARAHKGEFPFGSDKIEIEHSQMNREERRLALERLRNDEAEILVSVKALQEGIDVPAVGLGISVASTSSGRQRIQTMGRILRRSRDARGKPIPADQAPVKQLHLLYVRNTVDESIYRQDNWGEQTGVDRNVWRVWDYGAMCSSPGQALSPTNLSEEDAWKAIKDLPMPQPWRGPGNGIKLSYKRGSIFAANNDDIEVLNPSPITSLLDNIAPKWVSDDIRGRFRTTLELNVVLKKGPNPLFDEEIDPDLDDSNKEVWWAIGCLDATPEFPMEETELNDEEEQADNLDFEQYNNPTFTLSNQEKSEDESIIDDYSLRVDGSLYLSEDFSSEDFLSDSNDLLSDSEDLLSDSEELSGEEESEDVSYDCDFEDEDLGNRSLKVFPPPQNEPWYNWFQYLCFAVAQNDSEAITLAKREVQARGSHSGRVTHGGTHVALRILCREHPEHDKAVQQAHKIGRPTSVQIGHSPLIALAYHLDDKDWLKQLEQDFQNGKRPRQSFSRACSLLLGTLKRPSFTY